MYRSILSMLIPLALSSCSGGGAGGVQELAPSADSQERASSPFEVVAAPEPVAVEPAVTAEPELEVLPAPVPEPAVSPEVVAEPVIEPEIETPEPAVELEPEAPAVVEESDDSDYLGPYDQVVTVVDYMIQHGMRELYRVNSNLFSGSDLYWHQDCLLEVQPTDTIRGLLCEPMMPIESGRLIAISVVQSDRCDAALYLGATGEYECEIEPLVIEFRDQEYRNELRLSNSYFGGLFFSNGCSASIESGDTDCPAELAELAERVQNREQSVITD